jgi:hypothetical protein
MTLLRRSPESGRPRDAAFMQEPVQPTSSVAPKDGTND